MGTQPPNPGSGSRARAREKLNLRKHFSLLPDAPPDGVLSSGKSGLLGRWQPPPPVPVGDNVCVGRGHSQGVTFGTLGAFFRETGVLPLNAGSEGKLFACEFWLPP